MKSLLAGTALAVSLIGGPAFAADLPEPMPIEAPAAVLPYDWSGAYIGVHAGFAWGNENDDFDDLLDDAIIVKPAARFDVDGFLGGVHAGYNWQSGRFVFGGEGDFDFADVNGDSDFNGAVIRGSTISGNLSVDRNWEASLRLRAGVAFDRLLLYATGGVAFTEIEAKAHGGFFFEGNPDGTFGSSSQETFTGWTVGGGGEYALTDHVLVRAEARYTDFGEESFGFDEFKGSTNNDFHVDLNEVSVRGGISYKF